MTKFLTPEQELTIAQILKKYPKGTPYTGKRTPAGYIRFYVGDNIYHIKPDGVISRQEKIGNPYRQKLQDKITNCPFCKSKIKVPYPGAMVNCRLCHAVFRTKLITD